MKFRLLMSPLKIGSWKKLFLCGKKSLKKPAVELPHDIIEWEILPRLPAKSLGHFMWVCKQWKSFISTCEFARKNVQHLTNSQSLTHHKLLDYEDRFSLKSIDCEDLYNSSVAPLSVPALNGALKVSPIASLDGLVFVELPDTSEFAFWNPLTGAYKKFLSNSPRSYTLVDAFYFDSSNNDYKVLQVTSHGGLNAYIYSQRFNSWKKIQFLENHQCLANSKSRWSKPIFLNHRIYFMVGKSNVVLIVFDVKSEKFREIRLPILNTSYAPYMSLVVLKGCIHFSVAYRSNTSDKTFIWELWRMDGDGDGWTKLTTFSQTVQDAVDYKLPVAYTTRNANWLGIWKEDGVFYTIDMQDLARNVMTNYCIDCSSTKQMLYIQTLVSPSA